MNVRIFSASAMECMCAQTRSRFILSSKRVLREWSQNPCELQGENPLYRKLRGGWNPQHCITQDSQPNTLLTELFQPPFWNLMNQVGWLVGCLTSQQQASVSQGRICSDNFTCCHTEIEVADQTFYLTQSQYTDTGLTSPSADPITPGAWQGSHWNANF